MCSCPANQFWPCVAVSRGDASVRVGNQGILTQDNSSVMGYALESAEDHSSTLSCLLLPPLSCRTASVTPNTHCVFLTLAASRFHALACSGSSRWSRHLVNRLTLRLWLKNTFVQLCQGRNVSLCCWLFSGPASLLCPWNWFIQKSEVSLAR